MHVINRMYNVNKTNLKYKYLFDIRHTLKSNKFTRPSRRINGGMYFYLRFAKELESVLETTYVMIQS